MTSVSVIFYEMLLLYPKYFGTQLRKLSMNSCLELHFPCALLKAAQHSRRFSINVN